jgi:hypothetical protein
MPERFRVPPFEKLVKFYRALAAIAVLAVIYLVCAKLIKNPIGNGLSIAIEVISLPLAIWFLTRRNLRVTLGIGRGRQ